MRVGIVAIAKTEAPFLLEWVAFHRAVGIWHFFIADNGGDDGTSDLLKRLDRAGHIVRFDFTDRHLAQLAAYDEIVPRLRGSLDLAVIIDIDEFVRPLASERVDTFFTEMFSDPNVSALALNWACYGSSGRIKPGRGLVTTRFKRRAEQDFRSNRHSKPSFALIGLCAP
ncbi:glycosyltransferase family 2 protein [Rhodoplanes sp. Z2-YC6860]|uniref:glycosyltransferase family 2 protein n=1 Tax=Rhodoplanes sp. Z2-YC6860 TaxID=674703 RepID=UPI00083553DA|nr:glycosyltransferase family 2 protein [Rhodoplanes sp. Z2-YC6860]